MQKVDKVVTQSYAERSVGMLGMICIGIFLMRVGSSFGVKNVAKDQPFGWLVSRVVNRVLRGVLAGLPQALFFLFFVSSWSLFKGQLPPLLCLLGMH